MSKPVDGIIVISGEDNVRAVMAMIRLRRWRSIAEMKVRFGTKPPQGWTVPVFNNAYDVKCRDWKHILATLDAYFAQRDKVEEGAK